MGRGLIVAMLHSAMLDPAMLDPNMLDPDMLDIMPRFPFLR